MRKGGRVRSFAAAQNDSDCGVEMNPEPLSHPMFVESSRSREVLY